MFKHSCKDCSSRHVGCHDSCKAYLDAKKSYEKEKAIVRDARRVVTQINSFHKENIEKARRSHR